MKKQILILCLTLIIGLLSAGCSGNKNNNGNDSGDQAYYTSGTTGTDTTTLDTNANSASYGDTVRRF